MKDALTELVVAGHVTRTPGAKDANTDTWAPVPAASSDGTDGEAPAGVLADTIAAATTAEHGLGLLDSLTRLTNGNPWLPAAT